MTAPRYDIYRYIHKGLRSFLTDTLMSVGQMDVHSEDAVNVSMNQLQSLMNFCQGHLEHENQFIHTAMHARSPGSAAAMYDHHDQHVAMITELRELAKELLMSTGSNREALSILLYRQLAIFVADNLAHMHEEETQNNAVLWQHYSDVEIQQIEHDLVASIPADENAETMGWVLPALNHQERTNFLDGVRQSAPKEVLNGLLEIARQRLPLVEWYKLETVFCC